MSNLSPDTLRLAAKYCDEAAETYVHCVSGLERDAEDDAMYVRLAEERSQLAATLRDEADRLERVA